MKVYTVKVYANGDEYWFNEEEQRHRENGPAVICSDGDKQYYINGKRHREDGPAVICYSGTKKYYINGKRHREDGPAVIYSDGTKEYWINGKYHREDGPAVIWSNGHKEYYINGKQLTEEQFNNRNKHSIIIDGKTIHISKESFEELKKQLGE